MMSTSRLQVLESQICGLQGQQTSDTKGFVSTVKVTDGAKQYSEIIDYHPEKKVS